MQNPKCKINGGFSLVELMFAVILLTVIVFGVVKLQTSNLALSNTQKNVLDAHFYANQGVEIVKAVGYSNFCGGTYPCDKYIKFDSGTYSLATTNADDPISSPFERIIKIEDVGLANAYKVTSIIEWTDSTGPHNETDGGAVTASAIIF